MISMKPFFCFLAENCISKKDAAKMTGISYPTMLKMKKENNFNKSILDKICSRFNLNIKDIMRYEEDL